MYVFAHRVRSPSGDRGINSARYTHADGGVGTDVWEQPVSDTLRYITETEPGRRVASTVEVAPGGNSVEAFLEVVGPDDTSLAVLTEALAGARTEAVVSPPAAIRIGHLSIGFGVNLGEADVPSTFDRLVGRVTAIFEASPEQRRDPLEIVIERNDEGWVFQLDDESARRVQSAGGQPARVGVRYDVADDFRRLHGQLYPYAAQWVTGLSGEQLLSLGGARFRNDGRVVGRWPAAK